MDTKCTHNHLHIHYLYRMDKYQMHTHTRTHTHTHTHTYIFITCTEWINTKCTHTYLHINYLYRMDKYQMHTHSFTYSLLVQNEYKGIGRQSSLPFCLALAVVSDTAPPCSKLCTCRCPWASQSKTYLNHQCHTSLP